MYVSWLFDLVVSSRLQLVEMKQERVRQEHTTTGSLSWRAVCCPCYKSTFLSLSILFTTHQIERSRQLASLFNVRLTLPGWLARSLALGCWKVQSIAKATVTLDEVGATES